MQQMLQMNDLRTRIYEVLLGIRAPAAASTNWPSTVELFGRPSLLKSYNLSESEGDDCYYQQSVT